MNYESEVNIGSISSEYPSLTNSSVYLVKILEWLSVFDETVSVAEMLRKIAYEAFES